MAGASAVLDIGGSFGLHYKQAANPTVLWAIVETPAIVERAKPLETDRLRFFRSIPEAAQWLGKVETIHCNGAVQYAPEPLTLVRDAVGTRPERLMWYRLFLGDGEGIQTSLLRENGPGNLKTPHRKVAYRFSRISEPDFIAAHDGYRIQREQELPAVATCGHLGDGLEIRVVQERDAHYR